MGTEIRLAKPVEVSDNPPLDALFRSAPELQNGTFPVPSGPGLELDQETRKPRVNPL